MDKLKIGTCWLDGCSGCHMSLLDMDEGIVAVLRKADIVFGPLVDAQEWPEGVDVAVIEGAHVWDMAGRGIDTRLVSELKRPWGEATSCTSCGKCVQACPTGAMAEKGWAVEEMTKHRTVVSRLTSMREGQ